MEVIKNPWFVGISTGIISGVMVYLLTNWIMKKKEKEEYFKQVSISNQSVIASLKPYIAERGLPEPEIFKSLIRSTARSNSVEEHDMYSITVFCEELIREIICDVYVSIDKKKEYVDSLVEYKKEIDKANIEGKIKYLTSSNIYSTRFRRTISLFASLMMSIMAMIISLLLTMSDVLETNNYHSFWYPFDSNPLLWIPVIMLLLVIIIVFAWGIVNFNGIMIKKKSLRFDY